MEPKGVKVRAPAGEIYIASSAPDVLKAAQTLSHLRDDYPLAQTPLIDFSRLQHVHSLKQAGERAAPKLSTSRFLVAIVGKLGSPRTESGLFHNEIEIEAAIQAGLPVLIFCASEDFLKKHGQGGGLLNEEFVRKLKDNPKVRVVPMPADLDAVYESMKTELNRMLGGPIRLGAQPSDARPPLVWLGYPSLREYMESKGLVDADNRPIIDKIANDLGDMVPSEVLGFPTSNDARLQNVDQLQSEDFRALRQRREELLAKLVRVGLSPMVGRHRGAHGNQEELERDLEKVREEVRALGLQIGEWRARGEAEEARKTKQRQQELEEGQRTTAQQVTRLMMEDVHKARGDTWGVSKLLFTVSAGATAILATTLANSNYVTPAYRWSAVAAFVGSVVAMSLGVVFAVRTMKFARTTIGVEDLKLTRQATDAHFDGSDKLLAGQGALVALQVLFTMVAILSFVINLDAVTQDAVEMPANVLDMPTDGPIAVSSQVADPPAPEATPTNTTAPA